MRARRKFVAPGTQMHAGKHHFTGAAGNRVLNVAENGTYRFTSPGTAGNSGNAEGAKVVAAILGFNEGTGAQMRARQRFAGYRLKIENFCRGTQDLSNQAIF